MAAWFKSIFGKKTDVEAEAAPQAADAELVGQEQDAAEAPRLPRWLERQMEGNGEGELGGGQATYDPLPPPEAALEADSATGAALGPDSVPAPAAANPGWPDLTDPMASATVAEGPSRPGGEWEEEEPDPGTATPSLSSLAPVSEAGAFPSLAGALAEPELKDETAAAQAWAEAASPPVPPIPAVEDRGEELPDLAELAGLTTSPGAPAASEAPSSWRSGLPSPDEVGEALGRLESLPSGDEFPRLGVAEWTTAQVTTPGPGEWDPRVGELAAELESLAPGLKPFSLDDLNPTEPADLGFPPLSADPAGSWPEAARAVEPGDRGSAAGSLPSRSSGFPADAEVGREPMLEPTEPRSPDQLSVFARLTRNRDEWTVPAPEVEAAPILAADTSELPAESEHAEAGWFGEAAPTEIELPVEPEPPAAPTDGPVIERLVAADERGYQAFQAEDVLSEMPGAEATVLRDLDLALAPEPATAEAVAPLAPEPDAETARLRDEFLWTAPPEEPDLAGTPVPTRDLEAQGAGSTEAVEPLPLEIEPLRVQEEAAGAPASASWPVESGRPWDGKDAESVGPVASAAAEDALPEWPDLASELPASDSAEHTSEFAADAVVTEAEAVVAAAAADWAEIAPEPSQLETQTLAGTGEPAATTELVSGLTNWEEELRACRHALGAGDDLQGVAQRLEELVRQHPERAAVRRALGRVYLHLGWNHAAIVQYGWLLARAGRWER